MTDPQAILSALAEPFETADVKFKPSVVKQNRALAMAYIDARAVQDRLDDVLGVVGWQDDYQLVADGSVICKLSIKIGDEWITKMDVGSPSEQPDGGDRLKAAFSDALKRAAVKFGIGRYLYRLQAQWVDYDPVKKQFARVPGLPDWAKPGPVTHARQALPEAAPVNAGRAQLTPGTQFVPLRTALEDAPNETHLKAAYGAAYKSHERGEVTDEEFGKLTALKDAMKAKLAAPAA